MKNEQIDMRHKARKNKEMDASGNFAHALLNAPEVRSALVDPRIPRPVVFTLINKVLRIRAKRLKLC